MVAQITEYLNDNDLFLPLQSAYRPPHSTAVIKVFIATVLAVDQGMIMLVVFWIIQLHLTQWITKLPSTS